MRLGAHAYPPATSFPPTGLSYESTPFSHSLPVSLPNPLSSSSKLTLSHTLSFAERETREELGKLWRRRELAESQCQPSLVDIPRFFMQKTPASGASSAGRPAAAAAAAGGASSQSMLQAELGKLARLRLREHMASLTLSREELELLWRLLKRHASPPLTSDERINYDDFCQVAEAMPARSSRSFFCASHFAKFFPDVHGRISLLDFFQWARRKNALMETRIELSSFDADADGTLTERELEQWIEALIPNLPALEGMVGKFVDFYRETAVRKFLFFLDPRRRTRVPIKELLASPVTHELLELKRPDITPDELRHNWFSLTYAESLYADYLELDEDQNGMLSAQELSRYRGGGLTSVFIERIFQECQTYRNQNTRQSEIDYKSYLDFVLATTYKGTPESLSYFLRLLDIQKVGGLTALDVKIFFRAVVNKFAEFGDEANCEVDDVKDEIFDMVKPRDPMLITLNDLIACKVGDTVVGMLTDMTAFAAYDRREQNLDHSGEES